MAGEYLLSGGLTTDICIYKLENTKFAAREVVKRTIEEGKRIEEGGKKEEESRKRDKLMVIQLIILSFIMSFNLFDKY